MRRRRAKTVTEHIIELESSLPLEELPALRGKAAEFNGRILDYNPNPEDYPNNFDNGKFWQRYRKFMILRKEQLKGRKTSCNGVDPVAIKVLRKYGKVDSNLLSIQYGKSHKGSSDNPERFAQQVEPETEYTIPWPTFKALVRRHIIDIDGMLTEYGKQIIRPSSTR